MRKGITLNEGYPWHKGPLDTSPILFMKNEDLKYVQNPDPCAFLAKKAGKASFMIRFWGGKQLKTRPSQSRPPSRHLFDSSGAACCCQGMNKSDVASSSSIAGKRGNVGRLRTEEEEAR